MARLSQLLQERGASLQFEDPTTAHVSGATAQEIGELAAQQGFALHQLANQTGSLEEAYLQVTNPTVEYRGAPQ
jgi:ABC-2 type transport system ATP-binding protein